MYFEFNTRRAAASSNAFGGLLLMRGARIREVKDIYICRLCSCRCKEIDAKGRFRFSENAKMVCNISVGSSSSFESRNLRRVGLCELENTGRAGLKVGDTEEWSTLDIGVSALLSQTVRPRATLHFSAAFAFRFPRIRIGVGMGED